MADELTLKIGRRGAQLLFDELAPSILTTQGADRRYLMNFCQKLRRFIDTPPPRHVNYRVISVNGVPADKT